MWWILLCHLLLVQTFKVQSFTPSKPGPLTPKEAKNVSEITSGKAVQRTRRFVRPVIILTRAIHITIKALGIAEKLKDPFLSLEIQRTKMKWKQDYAIFLVFMILAHECSCDDCRYGAGIGYQGTRHVTKRNIFCQNWNIDYPHVPQYSPNANPDAGLHNNYCRNPNNDEAGPWCYTSSPEVRWEYCDVPMCGCEDWETQNGSMCVCKVMTDCGTAGPSVCDNEGNEYVNYCAFSVSLCQNIIPLNRTQESCGKCSHLKLTRGEGAKGEHRTYGLVSFEPTEDTHDGRTVYKSLDRYERKITLQFDEKMQRWIIGERASDGQIYLAAYTLSDALWPQDSKAGWVIYDTDGDGNGTWKEDALIQLHCFDGNIKGPQPRFFGFLIAMIVISLVTMTTSVVLQAVQLQKGCLWYPSVCTLTQEVKYGDHFLTLFYLFIYFYII
ncbi:plasminogen-like [Acipenser oxyrinchus oxyrinchus]|uniref:Plasminogen-like n=1 Tax=Acipenser oxyrinchus oxyrinchus TaxID=40147 RepID=A0AAD8CSE0_ACIOX|nr:plasminogen-like [Acipenser oxyrinchus oxyrinchus]